MNVYYEQDADLGYLQGKNIAVLGYGSQGHAHALNLKESGMNVRVGLRTDSSSCPKAREAGLQVDTIAEAVKWADIVMVLLPDQYQKAIYDSGNCSQHGTGQHACFRTRVQYPLQTDYSPRYHQCDHDCPEKPGTSGSAHIYRG